MVSDQVWSGHDSWHLVLPPSRPSTFGLRSIAEQIEPLPRRGPVAVLGSTPELRDLLARMRFEDVDVVDANDVFHKRMEPLRSWRDSREFFVHSTWQRHFEAIDRRYVLILSDLTLGNVRYDEREALYAGIARSLRDEGLFIDRVLTNEAPKLTLGEVAREFVNMPVNLRTINDFNCKALFCSELSDGGVVDSSAFYAALEEEFAGQPTLMALIAACMHITPPGMTWDYGKPWIDVERQYVRDLSRRYRLPEPESSAYFGHAYQFTYTRE